MVLFGDVVLLFLLVWPLPKKGILIIGFGIKKLQITLVVEDDKVSLEELQEKIEEFEDYIQSTDIVQSHFSSWTNNVFQAAMAKL